ncbi:MAG: hypothetical protein H0W96_04480 [Solirubrobacterales bacterium]|nr:hypothetical protein [Solirubrobacterales bacterium]
MGLPRKKPLTRRKRKLPLPAVGRPSWKLLGVAGMAGVAATGVVIARNRRAHSDLAPDELRERLHQRLESVGAEGEQPPPDAHA